MITSGNRNRDNVDYLIEKKLGIYEPIINKIPA